MKITHLGHSAVLVETAGARILIDPGSFSDSWHSLTDLDAILVTHSHPDHLDPVHILGLVTANGGARVLVEPGIRDLAGSSLPDIGAEAFATGEQVQIGDVSIAGVGGTHAEIHRDIPRIGNVGVVIRSEGEPTFFHPGDDYSATPSGVDVVAVPAYGPWAALKETVDFARAVAAPHGFPIHEGLLNGRGLALVLGRVNDMTPTELTDLEGHLSKEF